MIDKKIELIFILLSQALLVIYKYDGCNDYDNFNKLNECNLFCVLLIGV
jgi:hypothetical protein